MNPHSTSSLPWRTVLARWNATEAYRRIEGRRKLIHSHWSFVKPVSREGI
jgi:hypothetical protein